MVQKKNVHYLSNVLCALVFFSFLVRQSYAADGDAGCVVAIRAGVGALFSRGFDWFNHGGKGRGVKRESAKLDYATILPGVDSDLMTGVFLNEKNCLVFVENEKVSLLTGQPVREPLSQRIWTNVQLRERLMKDIEEIEENREDIKKKLRGVPIRKYFLAIVSKRLKLKNDFIEAIKKGEQSEKRFVKASQKELLGEIGLMCDVVKPFYEDKAFSLAVSQYGCLPRDQFAIEMRRCERLEIDDLIKYVEDGASKGMLILRKDIEDADRDLSTFLGECLQVEFMWRKNFYADVHQAYIEGVLQKGLSDPYTSDFFTGYLDDYRQRFPDDQKMDDQACIISASARLISFEESVHFNEYKERALRIVE